MSLIYLLLLNYSPTGIAMPPAGLCFTNVILFFQMSHLSLDNGWTDRSADCCVNTVDENITAAKIW